MKTIDQEFGITRGKKMSFNDFEGETSDFHGFFIHNNNLCWKCFYPGQEGDDDNAYFYNKKTDTVEEYWWGIVDGDFKDDITTIEKIKYIPFVFVEFMREHRWFILKRWKPV